ncbi:MAG: hypothetical protein SF053_01155 [Bacteroidia bacterium]|nr:hypothetical protein [Bacteroidia bacterium]
MKRLLLLWLLAAFGACQRTSSPVQTPAIPVAVTPPADTLSPIWKTNDQDQVIRGRVPAPDELVPQTLVRYCNRAWPRVPITFIRQRGDTIFVKIPDSQYLTQSMGSYGAWQCLAEVTYTLTELPGIRYVSFDFPEGDHARPGVYQRTDWEVR